jgi:hydrogenase nickel incorporation protein HypB
MCKSCGCQTPHSHAHPHDHDHPYEHPHPHAADDESVPATRTVRLERRILEENDVAAERVRRRLARNGIVAVNLISSPGSGKTALLEKTLDQLAGRLPCAVITGDQRTDNDARRLQGRGARVCQIETHDACHLDAHQIETSLDEVLADGARLLFIENVGNLVCPAAFDLGEHFKVALLSTTEGEDKPLKYPSLFSQSPIAVLTKTDLIPHLDWNIAACRENLRRIRPGVFIFELSSKTGAGMDAWLDYWIKMAGAPIP